jgi:hypothetical protein
VNARDHVSEFDQFVGKPSFDLTALSLHLSLSLISKFVHHFAMTVHSSHK